VAHVSDNIMFGHFVRIPKPLLYRYLICFEEKWYIYWRGCIIYVCTTVKTIISYRYRYFMNLKSNFFRIRYGRLTHTSQWQFVSLVLPIFVHYFMLNLVPMWFFKDFIYMWLCNAHTYRYVHTGTSLAVLSSSCLLPTISNTDHNYRSVCWKINDNYYYY
jgi:hypothetical protein